MTVASFVPPAWPISMHTRSIHAANSANDRNRHCKKNSSRSQWTRLAQECCHDRESRLGMRLITRPPCVDDWWSCNRQVLLANKQLCHLHLLCFKCNNSLITAFTVHGQLTTINMASVVYWNRFCPTRNSHGFESHGGLFCFAFFSVINPKWQT